jgi:predicted RNA-binding protein
MCLSTAYELGDGGTRRLLCEYVSVIKVTGDTVTLTDLMGQEMSVTGALESVDLVKNAILIGPVSAGAGKIVKKKYEMIREIFNSCSGNQMRDVDVREIETDDVDAYLVGLYQGERYTSSKIIREDGVVVFEIDASGLAQRVSFTEMC